MIKENKLNIDRQEPIITKPFFVPDEDFRSVLFQEGYCDDQGFIKHEEASECKSLLINGSGIQTLQGLSFFNRLEELEIFSFYKMEFQTLHLSPFPFLRKLKVRCGSLLALNLWHNPFLEHLDCINNNLEELDISENTRLDCVICSANQLEALDTSKNLKLIHLDCEANQINSLDLRNNRFLEVLNCSNNRFRTLDLTENKHIENFSWKFSKDPH